MLSLANHRFSCSGLYPYGNRPHPSGPGVLPDVLHAPGSRHLHVNATPMSPFHPSPSATLPLHHHSQPGGPRSCLAGVPHLQFLCHAQAVEHGASFCCPVRPLLAHLQGAHLHGCPTSSDPGLVNQDPSVDRVGTSPLHPRSAGTPLRPGYNLPSSPHPFIDHISGSTSSNLPSPGALHHGHGPHPVPSPGHLPPRPWVRCQPLLPQQLMQRGVHGGLPAGLGQDRHQIAGTVDQRCLLAVHCFIVHCNLAPHNWPHLHHPNHCLQHGHHCLHLLHLLLATPPPRHIIIVRSPSATPPLHTTVVNIIGSCVATTLCWV